ncbi:hypothetical protein QFZ63_000147 [Streptomyces sp. B3I7]|nr:hypothetical protein [Streptomyces sp. B3I7]
MSGKKKQNTKNATVIATRVAPCGPTLHASDRMHDATTARTAGIGRCFDHFGQVHSLRIRPHCRRLTKAVSRLTTRDQLSRTDPSKAPVDGVHDAQ